MYLWNASVEVEPIICVSVYRYVIIHDTVFFLNEIKILNSSRKLTFMLIS